MGSSPGDGVRSSRPFMGLAPCGTAESAGEHGFFWRAGCLGRSGSLRRGNGNGRPAVAESDATGIGRFSAAAPSGARGSSSNSRGSPRRRWRRRQSPPYLSRRWPWSCTASRTHLGRFCSWRSRPMPSSSGVAPAGCIDCRQSIRHEQAPSLSFLFRLKFLFFLSHEQEFRSSPTNQLSSATNQPSLSLTFFPRTAQPVVYTAHSGKESTSSSCSRNRHDSLYCDVLTGSRLGYPEQTKLTGTINQTS